MKGTFNDHLKTIGLLVINEQSLQLINSENYKAYIKAMFLPKGCTVKVDFDVYQTDGPSLFFIGPNQVLTIETLCAEEGYFIYYNRDFYCIQLHDKEVACDGLLFNNANNMPMTG